MSSCCSHPVSAKNRNERILFLKGVQKGGVWGRVEVDSGEEKHHTSNFGQAF
jgi:hypothetical protein